MVMGFKYRKWIDFLNESEDSQEEYQINFIFSLDNSKSIDRTEIVKFIRGIENVTTVRKIKEISRSEQSSVIEYSIRFVLPHGSNSKVYVNRELRPALKGIPGLSISKQKGIERVGYGF